SIHVFDKFSASFLQVETDLLHYHYGEKVTATISLRNANSDYGINDIEAYLVSPKGVYTKLPLSEVKPSTFQATTPLLSELNDEGENWYIIADAYSKLGQNIIRRTGHAAFSYYIPSATLLTIKKTASKPLTFVATVEVATASRYALQSVLFRKGSNAEPMPIETAQVGQWLEPGINTIQITFDNSSQLADDSLYLGYLRLIDYGQFKTVYQFNQPIRLKQLVE
ncbi:MAG: DUF4785 domain-containing protein, partial [Legionellales bacterium]